MSFDRILRSRIIRLTLAVLLIALGGWAFAPYVLFRVAPSAFINAPLMRVTSSISGHVTDSLPDKGTMIKQTTSAVLVEAISSDQGPLLELQRQRALAEKSGELAARQLEEIKVLGDALSTRIIAYHNAVVTKLGSEMTGTEAEREGCITELKQLRQAGAILANLARSGHTSEMRSALELAKDQAVATRCEVISSRLNKLRGELDAARSGIYLSDGINDVPYSQQQQERLVLRRQELEAEILRENLRAAQLSAAIQAEQNKLSQKSSYGIELPGGHVIWAINASPGSVVTEGQTIFDLADCNSSFVEVEFPAREFEEFKTQDPAAVRLIGDTKWYRGIVQRVRGSAARADDRLLAAQSSRPDQSRITVELRLVSDTLPIASGTYCGIGRLAEVRFKRIQLDFLYRLTSGFHDMGGLFAGPASQVTAME